MKAKLASDERYPFFFFADMHGQECDVSEETEARWRRIEKEFEEMQNEMGAADSLARSKARGKT